MYRFTLRASLQVVQQLSIYHTTAVINCYDVRASLLKIMILIVHWAHLRNSFQTDFFK